MELLLTDSGNNHSNTRLKNNFDLIRVVAALMVVYSHCYPLTGVEKKEPLNVLTNNQINFGSLGVIFFFTISGYLIYASWIQNPSLIKYITKRVLRIIPGITVVVLLTVFIIGPISTKLTINEYFSSLKTWLYLSNIFLYFMQYDLPGVFLTNTFPKTVNGSLWTLAYEFTLYIAIMLGGIFKLYKNRLIFTSIFAGVFLFYIYVRMNEYNLPYFILNLNHLIRFSLYFGMGVLFYQYKEKISYNWAYFMLALLLIALGFYFNISSITNILFLPYLIFFIAFFKVSKYHLAFDPSYGIYIFGFPIQQTVIYCFDSNIAPFVLFALTLLPIFVVSFLSWLLIEKPALNLLANKSVA